MFRKTFLLRGASALAMFLVVVGKATASSFKFFILYEPPLPDSLQK